jgi:hypothetical protein
MKMGAHSVARAAPRVVEIRPPRGCWPVRVRRPLLNQTGPVRVVCTRITSTYPEFPERALDSWGARVMGFGRLPPTYRGSGARVALIDSGAAVGHPDLSGQLEHGGLPDGRGSGSAAPPLFQRRTRAENHRIARERISDLLDQALARTGLVDQADGTPLHYTPHDFRRIFITDAILNGLPPHIAQVIAGHQDISVTIGYKAVYPEETIKSHLAFLARRRALRPSEEYRTPTGEEWQEFLGHFERRKVATGLCGRAFSTPCIHENAGLRCPMHWPDPAQLPRLAEIRDNLIARIGEAEREGWLGEVEGLQTTLAGADDKLAQIDRRPHPQNQQR